MDLVFQLREAPALRQAGFKPATAVLPHGPPGTGKTQSARNAGQRGRTGVHCGKHRRIGKLATSVRAASGSGAVREGIGTGAGDPVSG